MIVYDLAGAIAAALVVGKRVVLIVANAVEGEEYRLAVQSLPNIHGDVLVLCADTNNGNDWKKGRYDCVEITPGCADSPRAHELAREAATRCPPKKPKPKPLDRKLLAAIRQGRRPKGATG